MENFQHKVHIQESELGVSSVQSSGKGMQVRMQIILKHEYLQ